MMQPEADQLDGCGKHEIRELAMQLAKNWERPYEEDPNSERDTVQVVRLARRLLAWGFCFAHDEEPWCTVVGGANMLSQEILTRS